MRMCIFSAQCITSYGLALLMVPLTIYLLCLL